MFALCKRKRPTLKSLANNAMDIRRVQGNMPPVGALLMCPICDTQILYLQPVEYLQELLKQFSYWQTVQRDVSGEDYLKNSDDARGSFGESVTFGSVSFWTSWVRAHSDYKFCISKSHIVLYWCAPSFQLLDFRSKILAHRSVQNTVNNLSNPCNKFVTSWY